MILDSFNKVKMLVKNINQIKSAVKNFSLNIHQLIFQEKKTLFKLNISIAMVDPE